MTIPSSSYHCDDANEYETTAIRNAIEYILDEGGFENLFEQTKCSRRFFDVWRWFYKNRNRRRLKVPVKFDNIGPTAVFVDPGATVMRSKRGTRGVQRLAVIDSYNYNQA